MRVSRGDSQGTRKWFARDNEQERLLLKKAHCSLLLKIAKVKSVSYHRIDSKPFVNFFSHPPLPSREMCKHLSKGA